MNINQEKHVAVITGASSGIGKEAAKSLLSQGWKVIGVGRNSDHCDDAKQELARYSKSDDDLTMLCGDLAILARVEELAGQITSLTGRVDALLNNAGGLTPQLMVTPEGNENTFASNHLGHFLLTNRLLPLLREVSNRTEKSIARIINVSSSAHEFCDGLDWDDLQMLNSYSSTPAYCRAKLANILFTKELARRLKNEGIVVHAMHPGLVNTNFASYGDEVMQSYMQSQLEVAITPGEAASTLVWLATADEPCASTGGYYYEQTAIPTSAAGADVEAASRLWLESEMLVSRSIGR